MKLASGLILIWLVVYSSLVSIRDFNFKSSLSKPNHRFNRGPLTERFFQPLTSTKGVAAVDDVSEKFEVYNPNVVKPSYGDSLASQTLVSHTFGHSYGVPYTIDYSPPLVKFNKVVLTLDTTVGGVQFDRLAHLFLDGVEIWRTSTIEPGGRESHSNFVKDASDYARVFQNNGLLLFELNNVVDSTYTGSFDINLKADYYYDLSISKDTTTIESLLTSSSLPSKIVGLGKAATNKATPEIQYPDTAFNSRLPKLNANTTKLQLSVFTSGNANEEFWYTNVLDQFTHAFPGGDMLGHGPIRHVEVYIGGKLIAAVAPDPVIFTGGLSPSLWSPVVSNDAFDLKPIDLDVSALLPYLHSNPDTNIQIFIDNGVDHKPIGSNWITTANLHIWETEDAELVDSNFFGTDNQRFCFQQTNNKTELIQNITCQDNAKISSYLEFSIGGSIISGTVLLQTNTQTVNNQQFYDQGSTQVVDHHGSTTKTFTVGSTSIQEQFNYPLYVGSTVFSAGSNTIFGIEIDDISDYSKTVNGKVIEQKTAHQNGTSEFHITPQGNHGTGETQTDFTYFDQDGSYTRNVLAQNGAVVQDSQ